MRRQRRQPRIGQRLDAARIDERQHARARLAESRAPLCSATVETSIVRGRLLHTSGPARRARARRHREHRRPAAAALRCGCRARRVMRSPLRCAAHAASAPTRAACTDLKQRACRNTASARYPRPAASPGRARHETPWCGSPGARGDPPVDMARVVALRIESRLGVVHPAPAQGRQRRSVLRRTAPAAAAATPAPCARRAISSATRVGRIAMSSCRSDSDVWVVASAAATGHGQRHAAAVTSSTRRRPSQPSAVAS